MALNGADDDGRISPMRSLVGSNVFVMLNPTLVVRSAFISYGLSCSLVFFFFLLASSLLLRSCTR